MRLYNYLLFRLYLSFRDFSKENHKKAVLLTSLASVFFLFFVIYTILGVFYFFRDSTIIDLGINYEFWIIAIGFVLWFINYTFFINPQKFLRQGFKKDKLGGVIVIFVILLIGALFVIVANKNRDKIFKEFQDDKIQNIHKKI